MPFVDAAPDADVLPARGFVADASLLVAVAVAVAAGVEWRGCWTRRRRVAWRPAWRSCSLQPCLGGQRMNE